MAKTSLNSEQNGATPTETTAPVAETANPAAAKKTRARKTAKPKTAAKKTALLPRASAAKKTKSQLAAEPTDDQIQLRAYFLAERRQQLSLPGDANHDWIEARRQLLEEAQRA